VRFPTKRIEAAGFRVCRFSFCAVPILILQKNPLLCRSPAFHAGCFVGKVGDFVLFALFLSKDFPYKKKRDILVLHFKVFTFNS
jgi:hypothetical protein